MLAVRNAGSKGKGVFATSRIEESAVIFEADGKSKWIWDIPRSLWSRCIQVGYDRYVIPKPGSVGWYINHSCNPNCFIVGRATIIAARDIGKGEEVTFDYSTNVGWEPFRMDCLCGAKKCRKVIRSYSHLSSALKTKYGTNVSSYLLPHRDAVW